MSLQSTLDAADTAAHSISTAIVIRLALWLHLSGFPKEVQTSVEDLLFEGTKLFAKKTSTSLHMLKDSRATLRSLRIYTPVYKGKYSPQPPFKPHSQYSEILQATEEEV